jgi:1,4-dihydroxy-2-naphthoate octaprenyltransferase
MTDRDTSPSFLRTWLIAVRPFAYPASALAVLLGLALSTYLEFPFQWALAGVTMLGVLCFHTAANLLNDCYDHKRGVDASVNPGSGAIVRGLLTERQVFRGAMLFLAVGIACGLYLLSQAGWVVLLLGVIGAFFALTYTRAGLCLKYVRLGDAAIFVSFGVLPVFGTFYVQARVFDWRPILWSVPLALLTVGILHANNWRDIQTDPSKGCRTVASLLGDRGSAVYYRVLVLGPFALTLLAFLAGLLPDAGRLAPATVFISFLALPPAVGLIRRTRDKHSEQGRQTFASLDAQTAKLQLLFGSLLAAGFFLARALGCGA